MYGLFIFYCFFEVCIMQKIVDETFLKALGKRVQLLRKEKKMTQEDLGFMIGNSGKQIGRIERGEHNVSTCMIYQISKAMKIDLKVIFDFEI